MTEKRVIVWRDIDRAIRVWQERQGDATMHFDVLDLCGYGNDDVPLYRHGLVNQPDPGMPDADEAAIEIDGFFRFDGCSNWRYRSDVMHHICGREDLGNHTAMLNRLYDEAQQMIDGWDD